MEVDKGNNDKNELELYKDILTKSEFLIPKDSDTIDYGTRFTLKYDDTDEEETYTFVNNSIGLARSCFNQDNGYISVDSLIGNELKGKRVNDDFSYKVHLKGRKDAITITGKVIDIIKRTNNDVNFIISRRKSYRISRCAKAMIKELNQGKMTDELSKLNEITLSQYELLKEEQERLRNSLIKIRKYEDRIMVGSIIKLKSKKGDIKEYTIVDKSDYDANREINANTVMASRLFLKHKGDYFNDSCTHMVNGKRVNNSYIGEIIDIDNSLIPKEESIYRSSMPVYTRIGMIDKLLKTLVIATPPRDNTIGVGSKVTITMFMNGEVQSKRVEVINHAVSYELNTDYVEAISPLGVKIMGLSNGEKFTYFNSEGIVTDIDNTIEDKYSYQKIRKG